MIGVERVVERVRFLYNNERSFASPHTKYVTEQSRDQDKTHFLNLKNKRLHSRPFPFSYPFQATPFFPMLLYLKDLDRGTGGRSRKKSSQALRRLALCWHI